MQFLPKLKSPVLFLFQGIFDFLPDIALFFFGWIGRMSRFFALFFRFGFRFRFRAVAFENIPETTLFALFYGFGERWNIEHGQRFLVGQREGVFFP